MKQKTNYKTQNSAMFEDDYEPDRFLGYHESQEVIFTITVPLDEDIKSPKYYRHVLARISDLEEGDNLIFKLDTPGGDIQGITSLIHAVQSTDANVHCHIDTEADSAGSLFALNCGSVSVAPWARMMIHTASGRSGGTMANSVAYSTFMDAELRKMMTEAYQGFLSESELDDVFKGREFYFNAEQIVERLECKKQYLEGFQSKQKKPEHKHPNLPRDWDDN